jgi:molecular chaperone DnaK
MPPIIGIDLGTTNTAVAVLENGRPRVIEDDRGYRVLPSVISAKGEGRFVVGQAAHNLILTRPDRTVYAVKRLMGRRFDSPEVARIGKRVGYAMREAPDGGVQVQVGEAWMTPSEVAAVVLQVARGIAEKALGEPVEEAVITVPAHFNHAQRKATLEAAQIAGLRCDRLLNEPTAAALAYGHRRNVDRTIVIFDLGGGTFDVSVLRLSSGIYEILATNGDTFLGGEDFDYRIVDLLADQFRVTTGLDLRNDRSALQRIKDAAERAKCELSFSDKANVVVAHVAPGQNLETVLTRTQLEDLTRDLVERCKTIAGDTLVDAGLAISEVDEVILVGGQTRMPAVRETVAGLFGREPSRSVHPEEAVAIGAAVHAATLGDVEGTPAVLLDVTPFDLGIDSAGGLFTRIVLRNARIPCSETRTFATARAGQTSVKVTVRQGEGRLSEENEFLGEFLFDGLAPAPRMQTKIDVTFRIDANGMLHVSAVEPTTGERRNITIRNYAQAERAVVAPLVEPGAAVSGPGPDVAKSPAAVQKKKGFFDQLFGRGAPAKVSKKAAAPVMPTPAPIAESDTPVIAPLPTPVAELAEVEPDVLAPIAEGDDEAPAFAMPNDLSPADADDLYGDDAGPASFGLAGAHEAGAAGQGGDPFRDIQAPGRSAPAMDWSGTGRGIADRQDDRNLGDRSLGDRSLGDRSLGDRNRDDRNLEDRGLDASELFGEAMEEDEDPPTDPGLRKSPAAPPASRPAPARPAPPVGGLFFDGLVDPASPGDPGDELGFSYGDEEPTRISAESALAEEDLFGFAFDDLQGDEAADLEPRLPDERPGSGRPTIPVSRSAAPATDPFGFAFPGDAAAGPDVRKARKPARVKLHYRERAALVVEYRENLRRGGALIRTEKPLAVGRDCIFEVSAPGLSLPVTIPARVVRLVPEGMEVEYRLDDGERRALEAVLRG